MKGKELFCNEQWPQDIGALPFLYFSSVSMEKSPPWVWF